MAAVFALAIAGALVACGGGGDPAPADEAAAAPTNPKATEGLYVGAGGVDNIDVMRVRNSQLVLENGEVWIANADPAPTGALTFFAQGSFKFHEQRATVVTTTVVTSATVTTQVDPTSVMTKFGADSALIGVNSTTLGTASVSYVTSFTPVGSLVSTVESAAYKDAGARALVTPVPRNMNLPSSYDYDKAAAVADVAGSWVFYTDAAPPQPQANLEVTSAGAISGTNQATGCAYAGTLTPRPSGKNVFNVLVTLTGCNEAGVYSGVAYSYVGTPLILVGIGAPVTLLQVLAVNTDKTRVFHLLMRRAA